MMLHPLPVPLPLQVVQDIVRSLSEAEKKDNDSAAAAAAG